MKALQLIFSKGKYFAPALVFASINVLFGNWAIYIPRIKSTLQIDEGQLGIAIFFMALGTLTMLFLAPRIIRRFGVGKVTGYGIIFFLFSFIIPFIADQYLWLCAGMYLVGATSGITDIAMNTLVTEIEKEDQIHIMSSNHGFFSIGGFLGAGIGSFFLSDATSPLNHLLVVIGLLLILNMIFLKYYFSSSSKSLEENTFQIANFKPLFILAMIGFFVMASEGAIVDWSALYLENISLAKASWVGLGYTAFSATMAIGRFLGDGISSKFGSKSLIIGGTIIGAIGFGCVLLIQPFIVIIGFSLVGLGLSVIVPELFRLSGKREGIEPSQGISFIAGSGFIGFLIGPVFLGFLADYANLKLSFWALFGFIILALLMSLKLK
ncbi:MAG: MFS transporter [Aureibaculum sp.]